jgi:hypothetical protein
MSSSQSPFSARLDGFSAGPSTKAQVTRVRDVIVCPIDNSIEVPSEEFRAHPPIGTPADLRLPKSAGWVDIGRDLRIERLPADESELVLNDCTPRGHYFFPARQFGQRYSIVREIPIEAWTKRRFHWDADGVLSDALMFSRLIRDNGHSLQYAARIVDYQDGEQMVIYTPGAEAKRFIACVTTTTGSTLTRPTSFETSSRHFGKPRAPFLRGLDEPRSEPSTPAGLDTPTRYCRWSLAGWKRC